MPTDRIHLIGQATQRGHTTITSYSTDQIFRGIVPQVFVNQQSGKRTVYCEKRGGWVTNVTPAAGSVATAIWVSPSSGDHIMAFGATTSTLYSSTSNIGSLTTNHIARHISEIIISGITYILISAVSRVSASTTSGWYYPANASGIATTSYTGTLSSGSAVVPSIASTAGMYSGQAISGTGIPASTTILTVDSATQITMSANATANGAQTITKTPLAKIISANFPASIIGQFVEMDGYVFIMTQSGVIWNSTINTVDTWSTAAFKSADTYSDGGIGLAKDGHRIWAFGTRVAEAFYNAGYQTGSVLEKTKQVIQIGADRSRSAPNFQSLIYDSNGLLCWISGHSEIGPSIGVYLLSDGSPKKISTPAVDAILASSAITNLSSWAAFGHTWIHISKATAINLLYCVELGIWVDGNFPDAYITTSGMSDTVGSYVLAVEAILTNGREYSLTPGTYTDAGSAFSSIIQTSKIDHGTDKRKFVSDIRLIADEQASGTVTLDCSDDDYTTWVTLGTFDLTKHEKKITRCGSHKGGRAYRLTHATNAAFRWEALDITYTVGAN